MTTIELTAEDVLRFVGRTMGTRGLPREVIDVPASLARYAKAVQADIDWSCMTQVYSGGRWVPGRDPGRGSMCVVADAQSVRVEVAWTSDLSLAKYCAEKRICEPGGWLVVEELCSLMSGDLASCSQAEKLLAAHGIPSRLRDYDMDCCDGQAHDDDACELFTWERYVASARGLLQSGQ